MISHGAVDWLLTWVIFTGGLLHACSQTAARLDVQYDPVLWLIVDTNCQLGGLLRCWLERLIFFFMWPVHEVWSDCKHVSSQETSKSNRNCKISYDVAQLCQNIAFTAFYWSKAGHSTNPDSRGRDHKGHKRSAAWFICDHLWILIATSLSKDSWIVS